MYIPQKRDLGRKDSIFIICVSILIFIVAVCVCLYFGARWLRQRHYEPKYIPGKALKRKWKQWHPRSASYGQVPNQNAARRDQDTSYRGAGGSDPEMAAIATRQESNRNNSNGPQRETSIRSIITLPPYSASPKPTEQIIAREGERGGMDMVVEFPETVEEQETRREDQMEALYQLRVQRRQELADREARRQERRDARARGDTARLEQLARESRARSNRRQEGSGSNTSLSASAVIAEHQSRERERRISSVSYAELGHVRHDGSRLRADSHTSHTSDSDHHPLLQNAVVNNSSPSLVDQPSVHSRMESFTSTMSSDADPLTLHPTSTRGSSIRPVSQAEEEDLGALNIPPPPEYDHLDWGEAPAYESPVRERNNQQLPNIMRLPSIHINVASPTTLSPATPTELHPEESQRDPSTPPAPTDPVPTPNTASGASGPTAGNSPVS
ncbi:hypothetical protein N7462_008360 [Penicillium macrosclerotiorum]|uniref:uncharacterized protein n=1 Tax=Penicillium macrosclerotiorum TaxID=303699 RepID=UPI002546CF12|nr:uncharacterized protein N7462_008360 [Penicillium macrosclerotiorum]KAJ5675463.1 hypothetical protein N7462_008360 [Penicillium macrosclerotiorum]